MGSCFGSMRVLPEAFKGVHLPDTESLPRKLLGIFDLNLPTNEKVIRFVLGSGGASGTISDTPKVKGSLQGVRDFWKQQTKLQEETAGGTLPKDYPFFGCEGQYVQKLILLLKTNPFFASALTVDSSKKTLSLVSYDPAETKPNWYLKMMRTLGGVGHRVNFTFSAADFSLKSFAYFDDSEGKQVAATDAEKYAGSAIFNLLFYASGIHATIHVLHYLMTSGLDVASAKAGYSQLQNYAEYYDDNIAVKYLEVALLLLADPPSEPDKVDPAIVTGAGGFGGSQASRKVLEAFLMECGACASAADFLEVLFGGKDAFAALTKAPVGVLEEFLKHVALVAPFAEECRGALKKQNEAKLAASEDALLKYLDNCGSFRGASLGNVDAWLQVMCVSGLVHGSTLSYTRLIADEGVLRWRDFHNPLWSKFDAELVSTGLGTIVGAEPGRYVFSAANSIGPDLSAVVETYAAKSDDLKAKYQAAVTSNDPDLFFNFGFILSDFCSDTFDGKQTTLATYI